MLSKHDLRVVKKLSQLSKDNDVDLRCSHVAALYQKKRLLSLGVNKTQTHPLAFRLSKSEHKKFLHAECSCLKDFCPEDNLKKCTLYVVRVDRNGQLAQSKPCVNCQKYIDSLGIRRIVHTIDGGIVECMEI